MTPCLDINEVVAGPEALFTPLQVFNYLLVKSNLKFSTWMGKRLFPAETENLPLTFQLIINCVSLSKAVAIKSQ
jgi:hypothetical protein